MIADELFKKINVPEAEDERWLAQTCSKYRDKTIVFKQNKINNNVLMIFEDRSYLLIRWTKDKVLFETGHAEYTRTIH